MTFTCNRTALACALALGLACTALAGNYCTSSPNSSGASTTIGSVGSTSIGANTFTLTVAGGPPNSFGVFFYGGGAMQAPFGNGFRCVGAGGQGVHRIKAVVGINDQGRTAHAVNFNRRPAGAGKGKILPGSTWYFQYYYRDQPGGAGAGVNLSDGLAATFTE